MSNIIQAVGPYNLSRKVNDLIYLSGILPIDPQTNALVEHDINKQTVQVIKNIEAILQGEALTLSDVFKVTVYLSDINEFSSMNDIYAQHFVDNFPVRSAVEVSTLPKGAKIMIEVIAQIKE